MKIYVVTSYFHYDRDEFEPVCAFMNKEDALKEVEGLTKNSLITYEIKEIELHDG